MIAHHQAPYRAPLFASAMLVLTLLMGSSFIPTLALRGPLAGDSFTAFVTLMWLAMYAFAAVGLFVSFGMNWITWMVRYRLLLTFVMVGTVFSISWSVDVTLSLERAVHLIGTTIVALYLGFSLPLNRILKVSAVVLGFIMLTSVAAVLLLPELGLENYQGIQVWAGTLAAKNTLGFWAAVSILLAISLSCWTAPLSHRLFYIAIAAMSFVCLFNSVSATSLLSFITAGLVMLYLHAALSLRLSMPAMVILGVLVAGLVAVSFYFIDIAELSGRSGDLTGRGEVWTQTWKLILERPLTGFGYGTLWFPSDDSLWIQQSLTDFTWTVFHAHNGLLQVASEIGLPLTALLVLMIMQQLVEITYCQYRQQQPGVLFVLGFTIALLVSNYSEARLLINRDLYWIFFITLPVSMLQHVSAIATKPGYSTAPGQPAIVGPDKLREARQRKEQKKHVKERIKRLSGLKVVNSMDDGLAEDVMAEVPQRNEPVFVQGSSTPLREQIAGSKPAPKSIVAVKSNRIAVKSKALELKKHRRPKTTG